MLSRAQLDAVGLALLALFLSASLLYLPVAFWLQCAFGGAIIASIMILLRTHFFSPETDRRRATWTSLGFVLALVAYGIVIGQVAVLAAFAAGIAWTVAAARLLDARTNRDTSTQEGQEEDGPFHS